MIETRDATLLRIYLGEQDRTEGHLTFEMIVTHARENGLAGATVLRGPLGFGHSHRLHTAKILRLSEDLPVVVEIVDDENKVKQFVPVVDAMMQGGLITTEKVQVLHYAPRPAG